MRDFSVKRRKIKCWHSFNRMTLVQTFDAIDDIFIILNNPKRFDMGVKIRFIVIVFNLMEKKVSEF